MKLSLVAILATLALVSAQYYELDTYLNAGCSGVSIAPFGYKLNQCVVTSSSTSQQASLPTSGSGLTLTTYSSSSPCTGASNAATFSAGCNNVTGLLSYQFSQPTSASWIGFTQYSDTACKTVATGPVYLRNGVCFGTTGTTIKMSVSGSTLSVCDYSTGDCSGSPIGGVCATATAGTCVNYGSGSAIFSFSGASAVAPTVGLVLAAALVALFGARKL